MAGSYRGSRRGVGRYEAEDGREIVAATLVTVDAGSVVTEVGATPEDAAPELVRSRDRRVVWYVSRVELAIRAKAWRDRPITPDPKPKDRRRARRRNA